MEKEANFVRKVESKEQREFDALIILGKQPDFIKDKSELKLSFDGKMRAIAAANLYKSGLVKRLIVSGGRTRGPNFPSDSQVMAEYFIKHFKIPEEAIEKEEISANTIENIEEIKKMIANHDVSGRIGIISSGYHLQRIRKILENENLQTELISAESIVGEISKHHKRVVDNYNKSLRIGVEKIKEFGAMIVMTIDPSNTVFKKIAEKRKNV